LEKKLSLKSLRKKLDQKQNIALYW